MQRLVKALVADGVALQVLCGHRDRVAQEQAFKDGRSKLRWPRSQHNSFPSRAVDLAPFPIDWSDEAGFRALGAKVKAAADELGIALKWGGDWSGFVDLPHFELVEPEAQALARA